MKDPEYYGPGPMPAEVRELNRIGQLIPQEVERQRREYWDRIAFAEKVFGKALREIDQKLLQARSGEKSRERT